MSSECLAESCIRMLLKSKKALLLMKCRHCEPDLVNNSNCRGKLILKLSILKKSPKKLRLLVQKGGLIVEYSFSTLNMLYDYSSKLSKLREHFMNLRIERGDHSHLIDSLPSCYSSCELLQEILSCRGHLFFFNHIGMAYGDPLGFFNFLKTAISRIGRPYCRNNKCFKKLTKLLTLLVREIEKSQLVSYFKDYYGRFKEEVYREIFRPHRVVGKVSLNSLNKSSLVKEYFVDTYRIKIFRPQELEHVYQVSVHLPYYIRLLSNMLINDINRALLDHVVKLDSLWEKVLFLKEKFRERLRRIDLTDKDNPVIEKLASYSAYKILGVHKLMPFLLDRDVDEIYLDKPETKVYIDHADIGRCVSNITVTCGELQRFINHILLESKLPLNPSNPSLKWNLKIDDFTIRVSVDIPPLSHEGPSLDLRKIRHRNYTIINLVLNNTLSLEEAAFLILHVLNRRNIIICGEPGTGKTTLMNALDLCAPKSWRKVYVEDVVESLDQEVQGRHQLRLCVEPFETRRKNRKKSTEMIKLLHRSPDWICMGELQTKEHFKALFHAIAAGLRGIHTCHASSVLGLMRRWLFHCGVSKEDIVGVDLIVHMIKCYKGSKVLRRVAGIWAVGSLIQGSPCDVAIPLTLVFKWDPEVDAHKATIDNALKSPSILKIMELGVSYELLARGYEALKTLLKSLITKNLSDATSFTKLFDAYVQQLVEDGFYVV